MGFSGMAGFAYQITVWLARLFCLNVLWVIFTLIGFGIFGVFPATLAMLYLIKMWMEDRSKPILKTFIDKYKGNFVKANLLGWTVTPIFILAIVLVNESLKVDHPQSIWLTLSVGGVCLIVGSYFLFLFPVSIYNEGSVKKTLLNTFYVTVASPHYFLLICLALITIQFILLYTGFLIFFFASISAWTVMKGVSIVFLSIKSRQANALEEKYPSSLES